MSTFFVTLFLLFTTLVSAQSRMRQRGQGHPSRHQELARRTPLSSPPGAPPPTAAPLGKASLAVLTAKSTTSASSQPASSGPFHRQSAISLSSPLSSLQRSPEPHWPHCTLCWRSPCPQHSLPCQRPELQWSLPLFHH